MKTLLTTIISTLLGLNCSAQALLVNFKFIYEGKEIPVHKIKLALVFKNFEIIPSIFFNGFGIQEIDNKMYGLDSPITFNFRITHKKKEILITNNYFIYLYNNNLVISYDEKPFIRHAEYFHTADSINCDYVYTISSSGIGKRIGYYFNK